ncbi:MAG TPA: S8 family serine peptidase, partial [Ignavibacteriaceae bacterium]|nr:S8 family serine peptidase [Ignavibacteriaceae bacterium]
MYKIDDNSPFTDIPLKEKENKTSYFPNEIEAFNPFNDLITKDSRLKNFKPIIEAGTAVQTPSKWLNLIQNTVPCPAIPLLDGEATFKRMVSAIKTAVNSNHYIYILGWMLDVDFELIPGDKNSTLSALLQDAAKKGVEIRVLIWDNPLYVSENNNSELKINSLPNSVMYKDSATFGSQSVHNAIIEARALAASAPSILNAFQFWNDFVDAINRLPNEGSHHEKVLVVKGTEGLIGFCGGIDINPNRITGADKSGNSTVLHDAHCEVRDFAAWVLMRRFVWRWWVYRDLYKGYIPKPYLLIPLRGESETKPVSASANTSFVKIIQTYNHPANAGIKDRSIRDTLKTAIQNAKKTIYFEDQYMISTEIAGWLNSKLKEPDFKSVAILTQDDAYALDIIFPKKLRKEFIDLLCKDLAPDVIKQKVFIYMLNPASPPAFHRKVHSKIWVIDDELAIIGSANCSSRSMNNDSETAAVIFNDPDSQAQFVNRFNALLNYDPQNQLIPYVPNPQVMDIDDEIVDKVKSYIESAAFPASTVLDISGLDDLPDIVKRLVESFRPYIKNIVEPPDSAPVTQPEVSKAIEPELINNKHIAAYSPFTKNSGRSNYTERESAEVIEHEPPKEGAPVKTCEGLYCWGKTVLNSQLSLNLPINNILDDAAKDAIAEFQLKNNLPETKKIDPATERTLLECDAIRKTKGSAGGSEAVNIISSAKTKIEDWTKQAVVDKPEITNSYRDPRRLWAFVLHHMAFKRKNKAGQLSDPKSYLKTGAHFCIMMDGRIIQLHQFSRMIWHGNCLSPRSVAVEFEGNFPNIKGRWWIDKDSTVQNYDVPTQAQYDSGRFLARYLKTVLGTTSIFAHRQSSEDRENDPGPDIWYNVGQWAIDNLGMKDGGPAFKCGTGNPILPEWRTWGNKTSTLIKKEADQAEIENTEWDDELITMESSEPGQRPHYSDEMIDSEIDLGKAVKLNRYYGDKLGWYPYQNQINDLILPYSGHQNVSLGEEAFAQAVSSWQRAQGFPEKDCDGIIGPNTWKVMSQILLKDPSPSIDISTLSSNSIENPPAAYSSDKVPEGFKKGSYKEWQGLDRKSAVRVDEAAKRINSKGALAKLGITETDIDTFQRISDAETGGRIQNFYSYDTAIISIGFRQFTFIHNNIHEWINKAPEAFKRYGIEIDNSQPSYSIKRTTGTYTVKRIKGADNPEDLRWNGWAQRFYYAGLDYEVITAEFQLAKEFFARELGRLKNFLKNSPDDFKKFMDFYNQNGHIRAFFHELNNAAPSRVPSLTSKAINKTALGQNDEQFLQTFYHTVKEGWPNPDQVERIYANTSRGSKIKVFESESEFTSSESYERNGSQNNEMHLHETDQLENPVYTNISSESFVTDLSKAINLNKYYGEQLGWNQFHDQINELILPFSGMQNVSLGEEAFAYAVAGWQSAQGFSDRDSDGIIGPMTWSRMKTILNAVPHTPVVTSPGTVEEPPSAENIFEFNKWHAQKILDSMYAGIAGSNFNSQGQLENIVRGELVFNVNPNNIIIQILPFIYRIVEGAKSENYKEIMIGSFIREPDSVNCTGHCDGRCIDINFRGGSFESPDSTQMVIKILGYIVDMPSFYKKDIGFGMPFQGDFFGHKNLKKYKGVDPSNLLNPELTRLVRTLGYCFPDNNNHLHIQVKWLTDAAKLSHEDPETEEIKDEDLYYHESGQEKDSENEHENFNEAQGKTIENPPDMLLKNIQNPDQPVILARAEAVPPFSNEMHTFYKMYDKVNKKFIGEYYDEQGNKITSSEIRTKENELTENVNNKIHPVLEKEILKAADTMPIDIAVWLNLEVKEPLKTNYRPEELTAMPSEIAEYRRNLAAAIEDTARKVTIERSGIQVLRISDLLPLFFAKAMKRTIDLIKNDPLVLGIFYNDRSYSESLNTSLAMSGAAEAQTAGMTNLGKDIKVAVWENAPDVLTNLTIEGYYDATTPNVSNHSRLVCAIIKNKETGKPKGYAPNCKLYSANLSGTDVIAPLEWAVKQGCTVINRSFHQDSDQVNAGMQLSDFITDALALHYPYPMIVQAAGNTGQPDDIALGITPASNEYVNHKGYNSIAVGSHDEQTERKISSFSTFRNPSSPHNDRELPEIVALGENISAVGLTNWAGTSFASPAVAGSAALLQSLSPIIKFYPEVTRALLLTGSKRNVDGGLWYKDLKQTPKVDQKDGTGALNIYEAITIAKKPYQPKKVALDKGWDYGKLDASSFGPDKISTSEWKIAVPENKKHVKITLAWNSNANYMEIWAFKFLKDTTLDMDLDILVYDDKNTFV